MTTTDKATQREDLYDDCWECGKTILKWNMSVCDQCPECESEHDCGEYN